MAIHRLTLDVDGARFTIALERAHAPTTVDTLLRHLPMRVDLHAAKIAGNHLLWHAPFVCDPEATSDVMTAAPGAFLYWPERQFLELVYAPLQAESASLSVLGQVEGDLDALHRLGERLRRDQGRRRVLAELTAAGSIAPAPLVEMAPSDPTFLKLSAAREAIWRAEPAEIGVLMERRGVLLPLGPLLYAEAEARKIHENLWLVREQLRGGVMTPPAAAAMAATLLRGAESRLHGLCGLADAGAFLTTAAEALDLPPADLRPVLDQAILYAGRLAGWLDLHIPWHDLNDALLGAAEAAGTRDRQELPDGTEVSGLYVRTVKVGPFVYVSGTTSLDRHGGVVGEDAAGQTTATMTKIVTALASAGATMDDMVRLVVFVTDIADTAAVLAAMQPFYGAARPTSTLVEVSGLAVPGLRVEIQADAVLTGA